ncbi:hypothetical protein [Microbacterium sp.]|uniref:hypothetical protein n=1 Tax=Microbacterium sp. TaxID=51671 RepID=UPI003F718CBD
MVDDIPARMVFAGQRWTVTDSPTRLRESIWSALSQHNGSMYGWRFQATNTDQESFVFDVFRTDSDWHVHRTYR